MSKKVARRFFELPPGSLKSPDALAGYLTL
jgi:hypothetical protein